ncbi:MAG: hypothetical protein GYA24_22640 [Candidatus Lokiarchaeota archaeon]|nr:hypothetical protein [Candidatus Lokiarchaeota archaeon]
MSKVKKGSEITTKLRVREDDLSLPKLFDMIALISFLGAVAFAGATYIIQNIVDDLLPTDANYGFWIIWVRVTFSIMMYCLITFGTAYGMGRFMKDQEYDQVKHFRYWFVGEIVVASLIILGLGVFF